MSDKSFEIPDFEYKHKELPLYICKFNKIGSTQTWAYDNIDKLVSENKLSPNLCTLVTAHQMTSGIGSEDSKTGLPRKWYTLEGKNLNLTYIVLRPLNYSDNSELNLSIKNIGFYILSLSLLVCKLLEEFGIMNAKIKWVNDIFVNDKKIGGIICKKLDKIYHFNGIKYEPFVVGIGVNILHEENEIPIHVECPATSLLLESKLDKSEIVLDNISERMHFNVIKCITKLTQNSDILWSDKNEWGHIISESAISFNYLNNYNASVSSDRNNSNNLSFKKLILDEINERILYKGKIVNIMENKLLNERNSMGIFLGIDENGYAIIKTMDGNDNMIITHGRIKCLSTM
ncbi:biotin-acetyl-CoA carboxylase ligase [Cryptosporidium ryanae]|uniref:biotin-acetyl-CoA carboxylase ligase n=1 Tax=Cryptosporidium ryanae TaxID=515981 RepID=UPI00351A5B0C|nr:biotin-acetyl-CoA carboxylase ligase [Cryptosporidium ryanae]